MRKFENTIYLMSILIFIITLICKSLNWYWIGKFFISGFTSIAIIFMILSWLIYSFKVDTQKRKYFLISSISMGMGIGIFYLGIIGKIQHWNWGTIALIISLLILIVASIVMYLASIKSSDVEQKGYLNQILKRSLVFVILNLFVLLINFDWVISNISKNEANEQRSHLKLDFVG